MCCNSRVHSALGMSPNEASKLSPAGQRELWLEQYGHVEPDVPSRLEVGDWVYTSKARETFEKRTRPASTEAHTCH